MLFAINSVPYFPLFVVGVGLVTLNFVWIGFILAILCVRFRDIQQVVASIITIGFLVTPVIWHRSLLLEHGPRSLIVHLNPFAHMIEVLRAPLMKEVPTLESYAFLLVTTLIGFPCAAYLYRRYITRVVFWL
jgi:lipopolysaccharide transport system permease protein